MEAGSSYFISRVDCWHVWLECDKIIFSDAKATHSTSRVKWFCLADDSPLQTIFIYSYNILCKIFWDELMSTRRKVFYPSIHPILKYNTAILLTMKCNALNNLICIVFVSHHIIICTRITCSEGDTSIMGQTSTLLLMRRLKCNLRDFIIVFPLTGYSIPLTFHLGKQNSVHLELKS